MYHGHIQGKLKQQETGRNVIKYKKEKDAKSDDEQRNSNIKTPK